ncbi:2-oxoacid:acceptor oxidoreductase, alpha subunit [uncultured Desulfobacterium sp.]|uniref:2-oxoacid:acceptor oxidoreductase, alpha subunit n=1 Tax=uncultured Desulfobacterium sp. TaxID=201089 RepID=A0A445MX47_9BACT|nr:2-oxoacid:acceptor oxidoreductase, alpha subunit [uncultured Desulfobacterium sp.]
MEDINIVIAGSAGEGVQTVGDVLVETIAVHGYSVFAWQEFESRIRGGQNSYSIRISDKPVNAPRMKADILLALNEGACNKYEPLIKQDGILIAQKKTRERMIAIAFSEIAQRELGNRIYINTMVIGALVAAVGMELEVLNHVLTRKFAKKGDKVVSDNLVAAGKGYTLAREGCRGICPWLLPKLDTHYTPIAGKEALSTAAALAGCRFMAAYPMSPSTDIITILSQNEKELGVFTEQAEDEIAAVNMAIGASFAGARAMTATSGGGFALMVEAISLAGMTETPLVIILAQRPGPATGLPTRTAQGDLLFAINAGHGEFPKLVLAPADADDIFKKIMRAFNLADKYQIPVIVLTDQFLLDSIFSVQDINLSQLGPTYYLTDPFKIQDYKRYLVTDNGVSPRLYPGQATHLVTADSDEHDSHGHITEDLSGTVIRMVEKRLAKYRALKGEINPPEEADIEGADKILVGWGSSRNAILEGIELLREDDIRVGMIHFTELWPLPEYRFPESKQYWIVENNTTAQLGRLLRSEYGITIAGVINRYDGLPLTAGYIRRNFNG